jgi:phosphoglycerol transferase MdoB-like AlkP superfamily enzyme
MDDCLPLIIYSPKINNNPHYSEDCYQMDIYPTYQSLLGVEDYRWHGFGINLLDEPNDVSCGVNKQKRPITEEEAFPLSDRLIRNNYFSR